MIHRRDSARSITSSADPAVRPDRLTEENAEQRSESLPGDQRGISRGECTATMFSAALLLLITAEFIVKFAGNFAIKRRTRAEGSNPTCSIPQSPISGTTRRIAQKTRVCAQFAIAYGPGEHAPPRRLAQVCQFLSRRDLPRSTEHRQSFAMRGGAISTHIPMSAAHYR